MIEIKKMVDEVSEKMKTDSITLEEINKIIGSITTISDRLEFIRQIRTSKHIHKLLVNTRRDNIKEYQMWQSLCQETIALDRHDNTVARMKDVDRACLNVYTLLLTMVSALNKSLIEQSDAINRIEERLEMDITDFTLKEGGSNDVQGNTSDNRCNKESGE